MSFRTIVKPVYETRCDWCDGVIPPAPPLPALVEVTISTSNLAGREQLHACAECLERELAPVIERVRARRALGAA